MNEQSTGVFISHHSNSTINLVLELSGVLQALDIRHWYAERDIQPMDNYTEIIPLVIEKCELMLLLLNKESNVSRQVLREVQCALRWRIPVMIARLDDCEESQAIAYIGSTAQHVDLRGLNKVVAAQRLGEIIAAWKNGHTLHQPEKNVFQLERAENLLNFYGDEGERHRLATQRSFVYDFAAESYDGFISPLRDATFLDVGCSTGEQAMMFVKGRTEIARYVGIDRESEALERARELYPEGHFYQGNCEADDFDALLSQIEEELDIDDGLSIAYPDPEECFRKAVEICAETGYSGYRKSGRQICQLLSDVDMSNVQLHRQGLSTVGMSREQRSDFYELYFWFILDDLRKMHEAAPEDKIVQAELAWFEEHYKEMKSKFKKKGFYFNLGFMLFSATR